MCVCDIETLLGFFSVYIHLYLELVSYIKFGDIAKGENPAVMSSRDSIVVSSSSNAADVSASKTHTARTPEDPVNGDNLISQSGVESSIHSIESERCVSNAVMVVQPEITVQLANQGGRTNHSSHRIEQEGTQNVEAVRSNSPGSLSGKYGLKFDLTRMTPSKKTAIIQNKEKDSCVIDVKSEDGKDLDSLEKFCRICHLDSDYGDSEDASKADLIQLGCGCKGELGFAHPRCAGTWFQLKGNRVCEICGQTVKNIPVVTGEEFMGQWNDPRLVENESTSSERIRGCWQGQPFCNFLMACLVIGFVLPWFLRVDLF